MLALIVLLFLLFPVMSFPMALIAYFRDPRHRTAYSLILGSIFGVVAYHLKPTSAYDLYRHHIVVADMYSLSWSKFNSQLFSTIEPITFLINFVISRLRNFDYLQFFVVTIGYWILFYIIGDYAKRNKIRNSSLLLSLAFTLTSIICINFFSGLWNYLAMFIFFLAFYLEYYKRKSRLITYPLYIASSLIHLSMLFPILILIIYKFCREKINVRLGLIIGSILIFQRIIPYLADQISKIPQFADFGSLYGSYFINNSAAFSLFDTKVIVMNLLILSVYLITLGKIKHTKKVEIKKTADYVLILIISVLGISTSAITSLRFVVLVQLLGSLIIMNVFSQKKFAIHYLLGFYMVLLILLFSIYQFILLRNLDFSGVWLGLLSVNQLWSIN